MNNITATIILEMLGRPKEYIVDTMGKLVEKMGTEKNIKVIGRKISEAKEIENKNIFSCFSEIDLEAGDLNSLLFILFTYMPSHVEIITPEEMKTKNSDLNSLFNELVRKLHQYDEIAKRLSIENNVLRNQLVQQGQTPAIEEKVFKKEDKKAVKSKIKKKKI